MNQKNPLLNYRMRCNVEESTNVEKISYDFTSGLWKNELGEPIIKKYINNHELKGQGETLITETRESIDRSEGSSIDIAYQQKYSDEKIMNAVGETVITATREGVDRAENSCDINEYKSSTTSALNFSGETLITRTREGVDRSESSSYESSALETLVTFTRESVDRSERS